METGYLSQVDQRQTTALVIIRAHSNEGFAIFFDHVRTNAKSYFTLHIISIAEGQAANLKIPFLQTLVWFDEGCTFTDFVADASTTKLSRRLITIIINAAINHDFSFSRTFY